MTNTSKKTKTRTRSAKNKQRPTSAPKQPSAASQKAVQSAVARVHSMPKSGISYAELYRRALLNPFSSDALGVRVPDQFFAPTATLALREFASLKADANGTIDFIGLANPFNPAVSPRGCISNGSTLTTPDGTSIANGAILNGQTGLNGKIKNYRVVSWGLRIRNTASMTNASGIVTTALVPIHQRLRIPHNYLIGNQAGGGTGAGNLHIGYWMQNAGIPSNAYTSTSVVSIDNLLDLPYHARHQSMVLAEGGVEVRPKVTDPMGLVFRNAADSYWGSDMQATTSAVYVQPGDASYLMCDGWTSVVIGGSGFPANTAVLDVEMIYHLEGSPDVSSGTIFVPDTPVVQLDPVGALLAQADLNKAQPFIKIAARAAMAAFGSSL